MAPRPVRRPIPTRHSEPRANATQSSPPRGDAALSFFLTSAAKDGGVPSHDGRLDPSSEGLVLGRRGPAHWKQPDRSRPSQSLQDNPSGREAWRPWQTPLRPDRHGSRPSWFPTNGCDPSDRAGATRADAPRRYARGTAAMAEARAHARRSFRVCGRRPPRTGAAPDEPSRRTCDGAAGLPISNARARPSSPRDR